MEKLNVDRESCLPTLGGTILSRVLIICFSQSILVRILYNDE